MPPLRAFMFSMLVAQRTGVKERFAEKFPGPWLVWEPGAWQPAESQVSTRGASKDQPTRPKGGDALCFQLGSAKDGGAVRVGRAQGAEIQINDATVSREHLVLERTAEGDWQARLASATAATRLRGKTLDSTAAQKLRSGDDLSLGDVLVTFLDGEAFAKRLDEQIAALAGKTAKIR